MVNIESPIEHYSNGKYDKTRMENNNTESEDNSQEKEREAKLVNNIDKITKFVYPTAYVIFNVVYWYQLKD
jgi:uncharacterized membrane protein